MKKLRSGVFEGVSDLFNFINENEPNLFANDFSSTKGGRKMVNGELSQGKTEFIITCGKSTLNDLNHFLLFSLLYNAVLY